MVFFIVFVAARIPRRVGDLDQVVRLIIFVCDAAAVRMGQLPARGGGNLTGTVFLFLLIPFIPVCAGRGWGGGSGFSFLFFWFLLFLLCSFLFRPGRASEPDLP